MSGEQRASLLNDLTAAFAQVKPFETPFETEWKACMRDLAGLCEPDRVRDVVRKLLEAMDQEKDARRFARLCLMAGGPGNYLEPPLLDWVGTRLVETMDREESPVGLYWLGGALGDLKDGISGPILSRGAEGLIKATGRAMVGDYAGHLAELLERLMDRLGAADAQKATEAVVQVIEAAETRVYDLREMLSMLVIPDGRLSREKTGQLSERIARRLDGAAWKDSIYFLDVDRFGITKSQARQNFVALLVRAPDQVLLDILKHPFAVDDLREVGLEAWELKYGQQFKKDLWRFVDWATTDPRTRNLDFR